MSFTSDSHPIRVDFVDIPAEDVPGKLGMTFAPGKVQSASITGANWDRDLKKASSM
jgi:hypothetical protein